MISSSPLVEATISGPPPLALITAEGLLNAALFCANTAIPNVGASPFSGVNALFVLQSTKCLISIAVLCIAEYGFLIDLIL